MARGGLGSTLSSRAQALYSAVTVLVESDHEAVYTANEKPLQLVQTATVLEILHGLVGEKNWVLPPFVYCCVADLWCGGIGKIAGMFVTWFLRWHLSSYMYTFWWSFGLGNLLQTLITHRKNKLSTMLVSSIIIGSVWL